MILGSKGTFIFQSTLPRRERLFNRLLLRRKSNFNPRSRDGSDFLIDSYWVANLISIHAPAKGATPIMTIILILVYYFNPRSREGSDGVYFVTQATSEKISIHAPAKGATLMASPRLFVWIFQSTLPRRERHYLGYWQGV